MNPLQIATIAALGYSLYCAIGCPCESYLSCHKYNVMAGTGFAFAVAAMS